MDVDIILKQLENVSNALKCNVCCKKCINPVKVKVCGHYFCSKCFKVQEAHSCPKCKIYYDTGEVDYNNIAKETENILLELKECLLSCQTKEPISSKIFVKLTTDQNDLGKQIFEYNNKKYHVNYVNGLCSKTNTKGETPLHIACKKKKLEDVKQLIKKVDLNAKDFAGWSPLHEAIQSGSTEIVEELLRHGAMIDIPGENYVTPLHKAVILENDSVVKILLEHSANIDVIDYYGRKPEDYVQTEKIKSKFSGEFSPKRRMEELFCNIDIAAFFYHVEDTYKEKINKSKLVKVIKDYDGRKVTHFLIRRTHKLSLKILVAMLDGCFVLPQEWIDDFLMNQYFIPMQNYTFISNKFLNGGIKKAILNSLLKRPKLFNGISFFISGHQNPVDVQGIKLTKSSINSLITAADGKILHRAPTPATCEETIRFPYHANQNGGISRCCHYHIYEENNPPILQYQMAEIKHKSSRWLLECIINFTISD